MQILTQSTRFTGTVLQPLSPRKSFSQQCKPAPIKIYPSPNLLVLQEWVKPQGIQQVKTLPKITFQDLWSLLLQNCFAFCWSPWLHSFDKPAEWGCIPADAFCHHADEQELCKLATKAAIFSCAYTVTNIRVSLGILSFTIKKLI